MTFTMLSEAASAGTAAHVHKLFAIWSVSKARLAISIRYISFPQVDMSCLCSFLVPMEMHQFPKTEDTLSEYKYSRHVTARVA